ncbi:MAG: hypothetical protein V3U78_02795 [Thiotrichaceae bacterium]
MTVLSIVRKNDKVCIAADTILNLNGNTVSADINRHSDKIFKFHDTYFAYTGSTQSSIMLKHALEEHGHDLSFSGQSNIYKSLLLLHAILKENYFTKTDNSNTNQPVEDMHINFLLANPSGIYQVLGDRFVGEISKYWAAGSGAKLALGAMHSCYDSLDDPNEIATKGIHAACQFDHHCGLPMTIYECELDL